MKARLQGLRRETAMVVERAQRGMHESRELPFRTDYEFMKRVDYIFVSLDRNLSGEECHELAEKYFVYR